MESIVQALRDNLTKNHRTRRAFPEYGRVHVDRQLPFVAVYLRPKGRVDPGTDQLVTSAASYLYTSGDAAGRRRAATVVRTLCETVSKSFGKRFLVIQIWSRRDDPPVAPAPKPGAKPHFRIFTSADGRDNVDGVVEVLAQQLRAVEIGGNKGTVDVVDDEHHHSRRARPILGRAEADELAVSEIGIEIDPIYQVSKDGGVYPEVLKRLRRQLDRALKRAFFRFAEQHTTLKPRDFHSLGRRAVVKALWQVDQRLDEVASSFEFLLEINPINSETVWNRFRRSGFEEVPPLRYAPLAVDPIALKRKLYSVPIEKIEDPTLSYLFMAKQQELDRQITMLADRGTPRFLLGSMQLYGRVSRTLLRHAEEILERISGTSRARGGGGTIGPEELADLARREIEHYREIWDGVDATVELTPSVTGLMVSNGRLFISSKSRTPTARADALIQHEVGTHLVTFFNGKAQRFTQLRTGLAGYDELQEGLGVIAEYLVGGMSPGRLRTLAARVIAADALVQGASFVDVFRLLCRYGFPRRQAFNVTIRVYRGGGFVKDFIYLRGLLTVMDYLRRGGELEPLFVGKIAAEHIPIVKELQSRKVLDPPRFLPNYLSQESAQQRLARVREGLNVYEMLD